MQFQLQPFNQREIEDYGPIYAEPGAMPDSVVSEVAKRLQRMSSDKRKAAQWLRHRILNSDHRDAIERRIYEQTPRVARQMSKFISVAINPAADIVEAVAAVYNRAPQRTVSADGSDRAVSEDEARAFISMVRESALDAIGKRIAKEAYFVGPVAVLPKVRRGKLRLGVLMPFEYEPILDVEDPCGTPVALAFEIGEHGPVEAAEFGLVDSESTRYFSTVKNGNGNVERVVLVREVPHEIGRPPFAILRFDTCTDPADWHNMDMHRRIVDGALEIGRIVARMGYVRRTQDKKLLGIIGDLDKIADGQTLGDDAPVVAQIAEDNAAGSQVTFDALDYDTDPRNFFHSIRFFIENMAESTGVPVTVASAGSAYNASAANYDMSFDHDKLTELRDDLVWHAQSFEMELWALCTEVVRSSGISGRGNALPRPEDVMEAVNVEFGRLTRRFADPSQERDHWDWLLQKGQCSMADLYRRFRDAFASDDEALAAIMNHLRINGTVWDEAARRNQSMRPDSPTDFASAAEANGALGPMVRDAEPEPDLDQSDD